MITSILEKIPLLIAIGVLIWSLFVMYRRYKNINYSEAVRIFKTAKYLTLWVIITSVLMTAFFGIFNHINAKKSVHAIVALNYSEASQAQNSNGTRYNMAEIICDEVIEKAIEKGAFPDVTVKELKECLVVYPCVQGGVGDESEYHISTEFAVEYHASKHTRHLDTENVIKLITAAYKEYYIDKYTDNYSLSVYPEPEELSELEYMDTVAFFNKEVSSILNYLYGMAAKAPSFVTSANTTFNSIAGKVYQFKETQINQNLKSLILQNGVAKDKVEYIDRLAYQNKNTDFNRQKNLVSFNLCNEAIDRYSEEMTRIVLVPTWDQSGKYYMGRTKVGIDELSVMATEFSNNVASNEKEIMDNNLIIEKMESGSAFSGSNQSADELINSIYTSIKSFEKEAITAGREYSSHRMNQCISVSIYGVSLMNELKSILLCFALVYAALMLFEISKKFPEKV